MSLVLCILDGWGYSEEIQTNAIHQAKTPFWDSFVSSNPHTLIHASEEQVGLPLKCMGNSEVGHMNMGAGRVVLQDLLRIDSSIQDGSLARHQTLQEVAAKLKKTGGICHVLGLLSDGLVHASHRHMLSLVKIMERNGVPVAVHAILDGRDTEQKAAAKYIKFLQMRDVEIQTMIGRHYAMDRDNRWDRTKKAYDLLVNCAGKVMDCPFRALEAAYMDHCDEFCPPFVKNSYQGIKRSDALIVTNFDRTE